MVKPRNYSNIIKYKYIGIYKASFINVRFDEDQNLEKYNKIKIDAIFENFNKLYNYIKYNLNKRVKPA